MSNVDTAQAAYEAFGRGDLESLSEMLSEGGTWLTSDELPLGGETHGRDAILGNFTQIPNYWSSFSVDPEEFIDAGEWVIIRGTQRAGNDAGSFEAPFAHLMKFENGKIVRGEFYADSAKAAKVLA
jgi:ketosteroid isomerase-like protein